MRIKGSKFAQYAKKEGYMKLADGIGRKLISIARRAIYDTVDTGGAAGAGAAIGNAAGTK